MEIPAKTSITKKPFFPRLIIRKKRVLLLSVIGYIICEPQGNISGYSQKMIFVKLRRFRESLLLNPGTHYIHRTDLMLYLQKS